MKAICEVSSLAAAIGRALPCTVRSDEDLGLVRLAARDGQIEISATTTLLGYEEQITATTQSPGSAAVDARRLAALLSRRGGRSDVVTLHAQAGRLAVVHDATTLELPARDPDELIALADQRAEREVELSQDLLARLVKTVGPAMSADDAGYGLNGIGISSPEPGVMRWQAADGYRLVRIDAQIDGASGAADRCLLGAEGCAAATKMLDAGSEKPARLGFGRDFFCLQVGRRRLWVRGVVGEQPDMDAVIPAPAPGLLADRGRLVEALGRVLLMRVEHRPTRLRVEDGTLLLEHIDPAAGEIREAVEVGGEWPHEMGFNPSILADAVKAIAGARVELQQQPSRGALAPLRVVDPDDDSVIGVVMPMRLD